jgi:mRNA-degrading endonuclease RelE of RelBE toxin-antitoxin system
MNWRINVHRDAAKQLDAIPPDRRERILNDIRELADDPFRGLVKPLKGKRFKGLYRKASGLSDHFRADVCNPHGSRSFRAFAK